MAAHAASTGRETWATTRQLAEAVSGGLRRDGDLCGAHLQHDQVDRIGPPAQLQVAPVQDTGQPGAP